MIKLFPKKPKHLRAWEKPFIAWQITFVIVSAALILVGMNFYVGVESFSNTGLYWTVFITVIITGFRKSFHINLSAPQSILQLHFWGIRILQFTKSLPAYKNIQLKQKAYGGSASHEGVLEVGGSAQWEYTLTLTFENSEKKLKLYQGSKKEHVKYIYDTFQDILEQPK